MPPLPIIRRELRRAGRKVFDLSDSSNLYLTPRQGRWYEGVLADSTYRDSVAAPLAQAGNALPCLLQSVATARDGQPLTVVDCGPATAEESVRKLRALVSIVAVRRYVVIDVNSMLLSKVKQGVTAQTKFPVTTIQRRFEEIESRVLRLDAEGGVLLLFGSTGMNYESGDLVRLMRRMCFPGMLVSLESLLRNEAPPSSREYESEAISRFAFGPLRLLGADPEQFDFRSVSAKDRVRLEFVARRTVVLRHRKVLRLRPGDQVWTAFSRRPTLGQHQAEVGQIAVRFSTFVLENRVAASLGQIE
jgi:hypothetical protein